ncbi:hypothetical protein dqs_0631 [Azoarcus olearius]|uniref:tape measure protein n=1 Tax=Azoarcus sp. (strain BH72) TaxID=418699 RepID=UPI0008061909|nr:tape measure protein [Azoarcus olearius]ANQ83707.1 hypothetical protein dqs_0631 [Azoarcus olearius]
MADRNLTLALRVSADTKEGRAALTELQTLMRNAGAQGGSALDPFTASVARATGGVNSLTTQLKPLQAALGGLSAAAITAQLIALADTYQQMNARLRLATQYTGDFAEVQSALRQAAADTRAPLAETVDLYSRLAPSLAAVGRTGAPAVGIISTVNQAIALSGASAGAAEASLVQFGQGLASGALRGDELNSILEQTPALADAIAEGIGISRGELRTWGEQGRLTADVVVGALERVSARVESDFRQLPLSIGQAMTLLNNELLQLVGSADQGSGALAALSRAIVFVAEGIAAFGESSGTIAPFVDFVVDAVDGIARLFRIVATGLAGYTLAIQQALEGDLDGALATYRQIGKEVEKILLEPGAEQKRLEAQKAAAQENGNARLKIEQDLANEIEKLEKMRAVAAGQANADILLDDQALQRKRIEEAKKATEEQLKGAERLRDALRDAWDTAIQKARQAREEAATLAQDAKDASLAGADKANSRRMRGMTEEDRSAAAEREANDLRDQASSSAARSVIAAYEGDLAKAQQLAEQAAKQAERAEQFADMVTDDGTAADLFQQLGDIRAQALRAQALIKQQEAKQQEELATAINGQIQSAEQRIVELKAELAKPVMIQVDITAAEQKIKQLQSQLQALGGGAPAAGGAPTPAGDAAPTTEVQADTAEAETAVDNFRAALDAIPETKKVTIETQTVTSPAPSSYADAASAWNSSVNGFASGGAIVGPGSGTSDSILARVSNGEFILRAAAVRRYGLDFLHGLNAMRLPRFATGGLVSSALEPAMAEMRGVGDTVGADLVVPGVGRFPVRAEADVYESMQRALRRASLKAGGRA